MKWAKNRNGKIFLDDWPRSHRKEGGNGTTKSSQTQFIFHWNFTINKSGIIHSGGFPSLLTSNIIYFRPFYLFSPFWHSILDSIFMGIPRELYLLFLSSCTFSFDSILFLYSHFFPQKKHLSYFLFNLLAFFPSLTYTNIYFCFYFWTITYFKFSIILAYLLIYNGELLYFGNILFLWYSVYNFQVINGASIYRTVTLVNAQSDFVLMGEIIHNAKKSHFQIVSCP
jgi:hypothetical protein